MVVSAAGDVVLRVHLRKHARHTLATNACKRMIAAWAALTFALEGMRKKVGVRV